MRKIVWQISVSLDGYYAGPDGEIGWHAVDEEYNVYAAAMLDATDTLLLGRVTAQLMGGYWTRPDVIVNDPVISERMNRLRKLVASATIERLEWLNTRVIGDNVPAVVAEMRRESGPDIAILGSGALAAGLARRNLIDEYHVIVCPVLLGEGLPLYRESDGRRTLELLEAKAFRSGAVLTKYRPAG